VEGFVNDDFANRLNAEHILTLEECLHHESSEISIFTEKIFLVKCIDNIRRVVLHNVRIVTLVLPFGRMHTESK